MPRLADDFDNIRTRMEELRDEQERARFQRERTKARIREVQEGLDRNEVRLGTTIFSRRNR
jgi:chromosome segregation ATPase